MAITADSAQNIVRALNQKVRDGLLDKTVAKRLAVLAMQEVAVAEQEPEAEEAAPVEVESTEEPEVEEKPSAPVIDPKTQILSLLTSYETQTATAYRKLKDAIDAIMKGTSGPAFPIGTYDTKAGDNLVRLKIENAEGKKDTAEVTFSFDRKWELGGVSIPSAVLSSAEEVCHLALRKDIVAAADDVVDFSETDLAWERYMTPVKSVNQVKAFSANHNDPKVNEIIAAIPESKSREDWRSWAIATQAYLLGSDYSQDQSFAQVLENLPSEED